MTRSVKAEAGILIETRGLTRIYGSGEEATRTTAISNINLKISKGEFVSIMGPSGSGKSTLLHLIGLLDRPTGGRYLLDGRSTQELSDEQLAHLRNATFGFVFQSFYLLSRTTVLENVMLPLFYSGLSPGQWKQKARRALEQVSLSHRLNHKPSQLSGGEKQRVAIARALVNEPKIILADEPTGNLDSQTGAAVLEMIDSLHQQGHTIIVITHEAPTARYAKRIIRLLDGKISSDKEATGGHTHYSK